MEVLIDAIRVATANDATDETRAAGAAACRTILAALEAKPGDVLGSPSSVGPSSIPPSPVAGPVAMLSNLPPDQLLDLLIARLRTALPTGTAVPDSAPMKFQLVTLPPGFRRRSKP